MAEDFIAKVTAELDTAGAEGKLNQFLNKKNKLKIDVEVNKNSAKSINEDIEKGIKQTKLDTSSISKQLASAFNITDKATINNIKSQLNAMADSLGKAWDGTDFDIKNNGFQDFFSSMEPLKTTLAENTKLVQDSTGVYDDFFNYFKGKKIYISDALKDALGDDTYKELLRNNIGKITRDATKGIDISSIWGEMETLFPEHFANNIVNQADQVLHVFDLIKKAREDVAQTLSYPDMDAQTQQSVDDFAWTRASEAAEVIMTNLKQNIQAASEASKTTIDLDVNVNADKITSDIRSAIQSAGNTSGDAIEIDLKINEEQLTSNLHSAINRLSSGDEPVQVDLQINKDSLQAELNRAVTDMEIPIRFKIDAETLASEIRAAVDNITDIEIDLHVNTDSIRNDINSAVNAAANTGNSQNVQLPGVNVAGYLQAQQIINNVNAAGVQGQSVYQRFGSSLREAFSVFTMANVLQDGIYKVIGAGKEAISTVKELNDATVSLQMATGESYSTVKTMMSQYNEMGQELGALTTQVAEGADAWLRQGKSQQETNALIKDSMVLSKVANISSEDSTKYLTAAANGYKVATENVSEINDKLTAIDLASATDAGGLAEAMSRTAESADIAGISMDNLLGMIATVGEVTQRSMSSVGESFKTIFARMRDIKSDKLSSVGEDGEIEDLSQVDEVLGTLGIKLRSSDKEFRNFGDVLDETASKWSSYSSVQQAAIAKAFAGQRQQENFLVMMENWDKVRQYTSLAENSSGSAEEKFSFYLDSLESKTNSLKASMEALSSSLITDEMYAGFLDGAKAVTDFVTQTDLLKASLVGIGSAGGVFAIQQLIQMFREFSMFSSALDLSKIANMSQDSFSSLLNLTQGLSEAQTRLVLSSTALSDAQRIAILMNQGMSQAEAQATVGAMGLAAAQGTATASTVTLSGALKGLWATLTANPLILVAAGVTAAVMAVSAANKAMKEAVSDAKEAGNAWSEKDTSLQDNITKITELREALSSGTLTEQEAAQAKSELVSIQESLTDSYGNQVQGIDLINGSLTEQLALLDQVSKKEAETFRNENKKGIDKATKEMEKERHTYLGQFYDNDSDEAKAIKASIKKLQDTYGDEVLKLESSDGITMDVHLNADASTARDVINDLMTEMDGIEKEYGQSDVIDGIVSYASSGLSETKDVLDEYQELYEQAQKAELVSDDRLFKANGKEQTAAKWLSDYAKAIEEYNNALAEGDDSQITKTANQFTELDAAINSLTSGAMSDYADQVEEVRSKLNETAISADKFHKAVEGKDSSDFGKKVADSAKTLKELGLSDTDFRYAFETDGVQEGEEAIQAIVDAALECGAISDTSSGQISNLASVLATLSVLSSTASAGVDSVTDSVSGLTAEVESASAVLSGIQAATEALLNQGTGKSISIDDFNSEELADYTSALEYNNGALQLNADKVRELQKAKADEAIQTNDNLKLEKQSQYMENIAEIEQLQKELQGLSDAKNENAQAIQASIDSLLTENDSLVNQCSQLDLLSASLREATGAYQNWLDKQNGSESGDMFDDAMGAMQHIDEVTQDTDSEYYGRTGRESYKAAVEFIVPDSVDSTNAEAVQSYMDSIESYFTHDEEGSRIGLDVAEFCQKATEQGLMKLDEASGEYQIAGQRTMQDFADGLNMSMPMVQAMFGEMEEFGGEFSWADEAIKTLGDLGMAAGEAKSRIESSSGDTGMDIQIDVSDIETTEDKISTLENTISQMQDYKGTVGLDSSQVEDANSVIQYCITQKQMLEAPAVMSIDTSQISGELGNALSLLQQFQQAQNNVELQAAVGADTSEAEGKVNSLVGEIQGLSPEIKAKLNIDTSDAGSIAASLQGLTPEILVKAGVDSALVDSWAAQEKQSSGKVKWTNETGEVDAWAAQMHTSSGKVTWTNDITAVKTSFTATGTVHWTNTTPPSGGSNGANGTAHAAGTAHYPHLVGHAQASGNWGTKTGGTTLVGELGREIVVDPGSGTWHTVGDNGAEFVNIPAGSIVFNHLQTESLLERGFVAGRGNAKAAGSAMVTGGISVKQANVASGRGSVTSSNNSTNAAANNLQSASNSINNASKNAEKAASSWEDVWKNEVDWFERLVTKYENRIDLNQAKSENYTIGTNSKGKTTNKYSTEKKNSYLNTSISDIEKLLKYYEKGRKMYEKSAKNYAKKIGLSSGLQKKVQNGTVKIENLSETNKKKVEAYQQWYDKINDCASAMEDLKSQEQELYSQKLENITDRYDALIAVQSNYNDAISNRLSFREAAGQSENPNSAYYNDVKEQKAVQDRQTALIRQEIAAYQKELNTIAKKYGTNSTIYQEGLGGLKELESSLWESQTAAKEFANQLVELTLNAKKYNTEVYERASDRQSAYRDFKEATNYKNSKYGDITERDYVEAIKTNNSTIASLQSQKEYIQQQMMTVQQGSQQWRDYAEQVSDLDQSIMDTASSTAELRKNIVELRFKVFDDAKESLDRLIDDYDTLRGMLDSDTFLSDNGTFTSQGLANIALLNKAMDAEKQHLADYKAQLKNIQDEYNNNNLTKEQYEEYTNDVLDSIKESSKALNDYNDEMISMYQSQMEKENELLQDNISKRQSALSAKKDYYDYDKTIKSKTKDINALKARIAALEGTTNAAAAAKLAELKAQLQEQQEDLDDTKYDHKIEMESQGYDDLAESANTALENATQAIKSNVDMQKTIITEMLKEVKDSYSDTFSEIQKIIEQTGFVMTDTLKNQLANSNLTNKDVGQTQANSSISGMNNSSVGGVVGSGTSSTDKIVQSAVNGASSAANAALDAGFDKNGNKLVQLTGIKVSPTSVSVMEGSQAAVKLTFTPSNATYKSYTTASSTSGIVALSNGASAITVTGKKTGRTTVTVQGNGQSCSAVKFNVTVLPKDYKARVQKINDLSKGSGITLSQAEKDNLVIGKDASSLTKDTRKALLQKWYNAIPNFKPKESDYKNRSDLVKHFFKKGKKVTSKHFIQAAKILGYKDLASKSMTKWGDKNKDKLLKALKSYGFAKGGVIRDLIPADANSFLGSAVIRNGDTGFISARPGESVLTEEFTKLLKPSITAMNEFTGIMKSPDLSDVPAASQEFTMNNEYQFVINGTNLGSEQDMKKLTEQLYTNFSKKLKKDFMKLTGRNN